MHRGGYGARTDRAYDRQGRSLSFTSQGSKGDGSARYDRASSSLTLSDADPIEDRRRDRKLRRRQERKAKKQTRIEQHERLAQERRQAREEAHQRKAATAQKRERARQLAQRASAKSEDQQKKRHKAEKKSQAKHLPLKNEAVASDIMHTGPLPKASGFSSTPSTLPTTPRPLSSDGTVVPAPVKEEVRRLVNKLTASNVVDLTRDLSDYVLSAGFSRAAVMKGLAQQIDRLCCLEAGPLSTTGTLPFAGLMRGMQLLHGNQAGAELVEHLCFSLQDHLMAAEEAAACNTLVVLAQLYLLYGVDVVLVMSLLRTLLHQGAQLLQANQEGGAVGVAAQAVCAAACGLALMRGCGEKLLRESPAELESSLQEARRASTQMRDVTGTSRFSALVEVMGDIAAGHTRKARRTTTEEAAPVNSMLEDLCSLIPGNEKASAIQRRTMKRLVLTTNVLSGLSWTQMLQPVKPPRWYNPGVMSSVDDDSADSRDDDSMKRHGAAEPSQNGRRDAKRLGSDASDSGSPSSRSSSRKSSVVAASEGEEEWDEMELKRERIARMRAEEKAMSGQRLNTEHKRDIFKCVASAADDLECFTMLMYRDPSYTRFHDVCAVLLQCTYQERRYNPYYVQVLQRFCSAKPACAKTLQFALWDRFQSIRIEVVDVVGYFNLACCITDLLEHGVFHLSLLRGLDFENTNKTIGLFARVLLLRIILQLPASRLTQLFFGGDGLSAHDLRVDTSGLRLLLVKFLSLYFIDENVAKRWLPNFYDVVAAGTSFDLTRPGLHAAKHGGEERLLERNASKPTSSLTALSSAPPQASLAPSAAHEAQLSLFMKRVKVVYKALKQGLS